MSATLDLTRRHWLLVVNLAAGVFVGLPILAPLLMAAGRDDLATPIYAAYHLVCHQWAFRSFFVFGPAATYDPDMLSDLVGLHRVFGFVGSPSLGYKIAFCERDLAIYATVLLAGLAYGHLRGRLAGLSLTAYGLMILPMALDGFTQLLGWRESTPELRVLTGLLFGLGSVWLIYPRVDELLVAPSGTAAAILAPIHGHP